MTHKCKAEGCDFQIYHKFTYCDDHVCVTPGCLNPKSPTEIKCSFCLDSNGGGIKHDAEKPDMSLLSHVWLFGVADVLTFGKKKYSAHNWRKGMKLGRVLAAALRHIFAFIGGEDLDPETGKCHLDHASCCLMFARELWETRPDCDDRWKGN